MMSYPTMVQVVDWVNDNLPAGYSIRFWIYDWDANAAGDGEIKAHYRRWLAANDPDIGEIAADGTTDATRHILFVLRHTSGARVIRVVTIQQVKNLIANNPTLQEKRDAVRTVVLSWKAALDARIP